MRGTGIQTDPFIIENEADLRAIMANDMPRDINNYYELANNIVMSSTLFKPINSFLGVFDGKGHVIENLNISETMNYVGMFGYSDKGRFYNLGLKNISVSNNGQYTAGLVAELDEGQIKNCWVTGSITIRNYSTSSYVRVGGLVGQFSGLSDPTCNIENCYTRTSVKGYNYVGGIVGQLGSGKIINSYASGSVTSYSSSYKGGIAYGTPSSVTNSYYDTNYGTFANSGACGTPLARSQFSDPNSFVGWDFTNTWYIGDDGFPALQVFGLPKPPANIGQIMVNSYTLPIYSNLSRSQKATINTESILSRVFTITNRKTRTQRSVLTYTLPINTSVQKSIKTFRSSVENVTAFINPISAMVERRTKTLHNLLSHVSPIQADTSILTSLDKLVFNAYLSVLENPSMVLNEQNMTNINCIENPSLVFNGENVTDVSTIENPSYLEVN